MGDDPCMQAHFAGFFLCQVTHCSKPDLAGPVEHPRRIAALLAACAIKHARVSTLMTVLECAANLLCGLYLVRGSCSGRNALSMVTEPKTA